MTARASRGIGASFLLVAAHAVSACTTESLPAGPVQRPPVSLETAATVAPVTLTWADGLQLEYSLRLKSKAALSESGELLDLSVVARLLLRRLEQQTPGVVRLHARLTDVELSSSQLSRKSGPAESTDAQAWRGLEQELEAGFLIELGAGGIEGVSMAGGHSQFGANIVQTIASGLQLPEPPSGASDTWEHDEQDASGRYTAQYRREAASARYLKTKLRYHAPPAGARHELGVSLDLTPTILKSQGVLELEHGRLTRLSYEEKLESQLLDRASVVADTSLELTLAKQQHVPSRSKEFEALRPHLVPLTQTRGEPAGRTGLFDSQKIGDYDFESALRTVTQITNDGTTFKADPSAKADPDREQRIARHTQAFIALVAILRTQPQALIAAADRLRRDPRHAKVLLNALTAAETPACQVLLLEVARASTTSPSLREEIALALVRVSKPSVELIEGLIAWLPERQLGIYAIYGLGAMARAIRSDQPALSSRIGQLLGERLRREESPVLRIHLLRGVANSGDSAAFTTVTPLLASDDDSTRGAAVEALRLMDHPEVDGVIARRLLEERSHVALRAAINAAKTRRPSAELGDALSQVALHSDDSQSRYRAVLLMATWLESQPSLLAPLTTIAEADPAEDVRNAAREAVDRT